MKFELEYNLVLRYISNFHKSEMFYISDTYLRTFLPDRSWPRRYFTQTRNVN